MKIPAAIVSFMLLLTNIASADSISVSKLSKVVGYTVLEVTQARGSFDGADYGKPIALDNGWIFEFREYGYSYAYRPDVVVFAKRVSDEELRRSGLKPSATPMILYKLLIDGEFYDASRVR